MVNPEKNKQPDPGMKASEKKQDNVQPHTEVKNAHAAGDGAIEKKDEELGSNNDDDKKAAY